MSFFLRNWKIASKYSSGNNIRLFYMSNLSFPVVSQVAVKLILENWEISGKSQI